ncbi:MAG: Carbohydrate/pyrimidine kinase, PfkB family [Thermococcus sibiricus]|uniref:Carbohydrate/pyrimidine kinase, PfkB family n=2 Tax=Thermococcus sibiricus TaxID=172049 RepID=C6A4E3_THESM|nr:Carbohydrate/pyrimidine kinase, PfkB family [Thermococcus sibiricus MM 739]KUK17996.1 MAG: Carbohydrate/pyrimidine kinase, PfkB family [Thermococcus sibiricus]
MVGHMTHDIILRGSKKIERAGGGAYYSALALSKFCNVLVLTKVGKSFPISWLEELEARGVSVIIIPSEKSTVYKLHYTSENGRTLELLSRADPFYPEELPKEKFDMVLLNPVANEIPLDALNSFKDKYLAIDVQGFIREIKNMRVRLKNIDASFLKPANIIHADVNEFQRLKNMNPKEFEVLLISNGPESGIAYHRGDKYIYKPLKKKIKESTGAGDVFLAVFSYLYKKYSFIQALKMTNTFTATFLEKRDFNFSLDEVAEKSKFIEVKRINDEEGEPHG